MTSLQRDPGELLTCGAAMFGPVTLAGAAATIDITPGCCQLSVPYTGTLTRQARGTITSALRQLMIELRYGRQLKGVSVDAGGQVLTVTAVASVFAIKQWVASGEFVAAVDRAVTLAEPATVREAA